MSSLLAAPLALAEDTVNADAEVIQVAMVTKEQPRECGRYERTCYTSYEEGYTFNDLAEELAAGLGVSVDRVLEKSGWSEFADTTIVPGRLYYYKL